MDLIIMYLIKTNKQWNEIIKPLMPRSYSDLFSDFLISRGQRDVTWKLPIIPFGDCRMHFYTLFPTKFHKTAGNCTSPTEKSNYAHWN